MRVPLVYLSCCPASDCLGKQGELSENCVPNLSVRFILLGSSVMMWSMWCYNKFSKKPSEMLPTLHRVWRLVFLKICNFLLGSIR